MRDDIVFLHNKQLLRCMFQLATLSFLNLDTKLWEKMYVPATRSFLNMDTDNYERNCGPSTLLFLPWETARYTITSVIIFITLMTRTLIYHSH